MTQVRRCRPDEGPALLAIINDAARRYRGVIPEDRWHEPYMDGAELAGEVKAGVEFWGFERERRLIAVMGTQPVNDVTLIRHAYVRADAQGQGVGSKLLTSLLDSGSGPVLVGTWAAATWAITFYERHGFELVRKDEVPQLLRTYWSIPDRQIETSVVLRLDR